MTDIEQKALALVNDCGGKHTYLKREWNPRYEALCRAIEQHEAFRQEVSDALLEYYGGYHNASGEPLERFIIPAPKPDPIAEAWIEATGNTVGMEPLNAALEARGLEIRAKNDA